MTLPLIARDAAPTVLVTNEDIADAFDAEDIERHAGPVKLVDVGVWLAAVWGRHAHHPVAADWFGREVDDIVFCRVTQLGLLRLLSNPAIMGDDAIDRSQAWRTYDQLWADERVLWADEPAELDAVWRALSARADQNHTLWTDDYLAAFAQASDATLITLDRKLAARYPSVQVELLLPGRGRRNAR
ncbi:MAG TPA: TA system VapC family ribonuclease toxin [Streptosporangiaceae bacterium]